MRFFTELKSLTGFGLKSLLCITAGQSEAATCETKRKSEPAWKAEQSRRCPAFQADFQSAALPQATLSLACSLKMVPFRHLNREMQRSNWYKI